MGRTGVRTVTKQTKLCSRCGWVMEKGAGCPRNAGLAWLGETAPEIDSRSSSLNNALFHRLHGEAGHYLRGGQDHGCWKSSG